MSQTLSRQGRGPSHHRDKGAGLSGLGKRTWVAAGLILLVIPAVIATGVFVLNDRQYYLIALAIVVCTLLPFLLVFEHRRPKARELVVLAVLTAIGVAGRGALFMIPQFKPVTAIVIITGVTLGPEAGFLVGAMTGFTSNFFFGQGPWTPWQMFAFGIIGFLSGIVFRSPGLRRLPLLVVFGALATFVVYGLIMDTATILMFYPEPTWRLAWITYGSGVPMNAVHAAATVVFLVVLARPMIEKIERVQIKYGLIEPGPARSAES